MHPVPLDSLEKRKIGQKPAAALGRTVDSIKAAFPEYKGSPLYYGNDSPTSGRSLVAISRPATGFNIETGDVFNVLILKSRMQKMITVSNLSLGFGQDPCYGRRRQGT